MCWKKYNKIMVDILDEVVSPDDLQRYENIFYEQTKTSTVTNTAQFEYAWCLVRNKYPADVKKGIMLLEDLFTKVDESEKRDCLYYLAIGNARIKNYVKALSYIKSFLQVEPGNQQVLDLERRIKDKMLKESRVGLAVALGSVLLGVAVTVGVSLAKKH